MKIFIDTEFDGFKDVDGTGELISMGLIDEDGHEFYEVLDTPYIECDWVKKNVIPVLNKKPISKIEFQQKLNDYLKNYEYVILVADFPRDVTHFFNMLEITPGELLIDCPRIISSMINRNLNSDKSEINHNALEDAKAIRQMFYDVNS